MNIWFNAALLSMAGAYCYRRGGTSAGTLWRDIGVPACMLSFFFHTGNWNWILLFCFVLMFAAQTTYNKWAQRLIGIKTDDVMWVGWLVTGLAFSFALFPYAIATGHWAGFGWRTLAVAGFTVVWSEICGSDVWEERGRGWVQIITLPFLA